MEPGPGGLGCLIQNLYNNEMAKAPAKPGLIWDEIVMKKMLLTMENG